MGVGRSEQAIQAEAQRHVLGRVQLQGRLLKKSMHVYSGSALLEWEQSLDLVRQVCDSDMLFLPEQVTRQRGCSPQPQVSATYEDCPLSLLDEIELRKAKGTQFREEQLWLLVLSITDCLARFEGESESVACVHPGNILINQEGNIRLLNRYSLPAGQQYSRWQYECPQSKLPHTFSQSYALGVTILQCIGKRPCHGLFIKSAGETDQELALSIKTALDQATLSGFLKHTVRRMSKRSNRPSVGQINALLKPYQREIQQLVRFKFDVRRSNQALRQYFERIKSCPQVLAYYQSHDNFICLEEDKPGAALSFSEYLKQERHGRASRRSRVEVRQSLLNQSKCMTFVPLSWKDDLRPMPELKPKEVIKSQLPKFYTPVVRTA